MFNKCFLPAEMMPGDLLEDLMSSEGILTSRRSMKLFVLNAFSCETETRNQVAFSVVNRKMIIKTDVLVAGCHGNGCVSLVV